MINVGINGFGRIGRMAFRIALAKHSGDVEITAVNTSGSMSIDGWAYLVNYDSMYGKFGIPIDSEEVKTPDTLTDEDPLLGYF